MPYWLMKSEPESYSIDHLKRDKVTPWSGVRNYQARNHMRAMSVGDRVLFYHSSVVPPGVAGLAEVVALAHPDATQFEKKGDYYDAKATKAKPIWECVDVAYRRKFKRLIPLDELRVVKALRKMELLRRGSRLSVQPVTREEFDAILEIAAKG
jgi:predicted RNA-binding protein with PUA-like domain